MLLYVFIAGVLIGSFLNVCIYRIPAGESIVFPPSRCGSCKTRLKPIDLIPVLSYLCSRGKCRHCGVSYSMQYPVIELTNGLLYGLAYMKLGFQWETLLWMILLSTFLVIGMIDMEHQIIPDGCVLMVLGLSVLRVALQWGAQGILVDALIGFGLAGGLFYLIDRIAEYYYQREAMGGGDIKLIAALGLWFGWQNILLVILFSFWLGAIISVLLLVMKVKNRDQLVPFGPFIVISACFVLFYGDIVLDWYMRLLT